MSLYYNIENYILQEIDDNLYQTWVDTNNPKANYYILAPQKPSEDAVWSGGSWVIPQIVVPSSISARQIRLWLIQNNIALQAVNDAINNINDPIVRETIMIEWEYAPYIERDHPMLVPLAQSLGLTEDDINRAFIEGSII